MKILVIAGARPNFMKVAAILDAMPFARLCHTGQHYDPKLSGVFFKELGIPAPDYELNVGSGTHSSQTAEIIKGFESVLEGYQPEGVLLVGDVNSTLACAITASKFHLKNAFSFCGTTRTRPVIIHVEAGLRSGDRDMPEEINRVVTDSLSDLFFVTEEAGRKHLLREGHNSDKIFLVGNVMIDTLFKNREAAAKTGLLEKFGLKSGGYAVVTLHRPSNVDNVAQLRELFEVLDEVAHEVPIVFPVHPRTKKNLEMHSIKLDTSRWILCEPLGYLEFLNLLMNCRLALTDSGGLQEETTALQIPCITLRNNTERPVTVEEGTNILAGTEPSSIRLAAFEALKNQKKGKIPEKWDGHTAVRIAGILKDMFA
ncbi:MAG: UDP-N-acetylglucosamine 2-epimerase (non-hydrolyzing) [Verrucomicrobiota bacterium]|nr:UDP-N-acetylglucosamine 2-epimerase (non-hydrolyzing) [Verrucomicrobiota bacterium]